MFTNWQRMLGVAVVAALLSACDGTIDTKEDDAGGMDAGGANATGTGGANATALGSGTGFQGDPLDDPTSLLATRTVYFAYNQDTVLEEDRPVVEAHAEYLAETPNAGVTLEGHGDERGSREYNVALGERRASSVRQLMSLLGASGNQMRLVSYGEERSAVDGHDEQSWALNRRVELIYRQP